MLSTAGRLRELRLRVSFRSVTVVSAIFLALVVIVFLSTPDPEQRTVFSDVIGPLVAVLAAASLLLAAKRSAARSKRLAFAWATIGIGMALYAIGDIIWYVMELLLEEAPFPSLADGFYLAYYPFFLAGVILLTNKPVGVADQIRKGLDVGTIFVAAVLGFWIFLIGPTLTVNASATVLEQVILTAYPVGDLVLLGALLLVLYGSTTGDDLHWIYVLAVGIASTIVADIIYSYLALQGSYVSGSLVDVGWIGGNLAIGLAGVPQWAPAPPAERRAETARWVAFQARLNSTGTYLPYFWLVGAFALLILWGLMPMSISFLAMALSVGLIMGLVLVRQLITLSENSRLAIQLKTQAARLKSANRELSAEIAERQRMEEKLSHDAVHDNMTGLANRILFIDRVGQAIARGRRHKKQSLAVLFIDVDHFKVVNDSLGHACGDQLLILIGQRLKESVRATDTVARFGGDEFTVLLEELNAKNSARLLTDRIQSAMRRPFQVNGHVVHASVSIGVATNVIKYDRPDDMLRDADVALYHAKTLGKDRSAVFALDMRDQVLSRLELEEDLRRGLERSEFLLFYQPVRSLLTDRIVGLEALLRWRHPDRGLLLPEQFLSVAEESGLMLPLGAWVLQQACSQLQAWRHKHRHLRRLTMSVNLSNREFSQANLAHSVAAALKKSGLKGSSLRLEITEQVMIGNRPLARRLVAQLQKLGVGLQIDDFGIGYSALAYLQQFPISAIKIDKSFTHQMMRDRRGLGLVRAMVSMARELGMDAIAEGIETGRQLKELKELSCGFGQGYLLAEPTDATTVEKSLAQPKLIAQK